MLIHRETGRLAPASAGRLALALLFAPGLAQVTAAEICRTGCSEARQFSTVVECCQARIVRSCRDTRRAGK